MGPLFLMCAGVFERPGARLYDSLLKAMYGDPIVAGEMYGDPIVAGEMYGDPIVPVG